jgi:hypothetical protein
LAVDWFTLGAAFGGLLVSSLALLINWRNYRRQKRVDEATAAAEKRRIEAEARAGALVTLDLVTWYGSSAEDAHESPVVSSNGAAPRLPIQPPATLEELAQGLTGLFFIGVVARNGGRTAVEVRRVELQQVRDAGRSAWAGGFINGPPLPTMLPGLSARRWGSHQLSLHDALDDKRQLTHHGMRFAAELGDGTEAYSSPFALNYAWQEGQKPEWFEELQRQRLEQRPG